MMNRGDEVPSRIKYCALLNANREHRRRNSNLSAEYIFSCLRKEGLYARA